MLYQALFWAAGAGAMIPEVILFPYAHDVFLWNADLVLPDIIRFVAVFVNRRLQQVFRHFKRFSEKSPSVPGGVRIHFC